MKVYNEINLGLQQLDPEEIDPKISIASGVIDVTAESEDPLAGLLSTETKRILTRYSFYDNYEIPNNNIEPMKTMVDEFVESYRRHLSPDFDPVLVKPIRFPPVETNRILMTVFDLLEGL